MILALIGVSGRLSGAEVGILVTAVRDSGGVTSVRLTNSATGATAWMAVGQTFGGYVVSSFDSRTNSVILVRDNVRLVIPLRTPQVQGSRGGAASSQPAVAAAPEQAPPAAPPTVNTAAAAAASAPPAPPPSE